ncbi:MAG: hypothetical protein P8Z75_12955, partial [Gammaproteobacteria bacterium]
NNEQDGDTNHEFHDGKTVLVLCSWHFHSVLVMMLSGLTAIAQGSQLLFHRQCIVTSAHYLYDAERGFLTVYRARALDL